MELSQWLLLIAGLLGAAVVASLLADRLRLPLTVLLAGVGFLGNLLVSPPFDGEVFEEVLINLFLPLLVYAAVAELPIRSFFRNLVPIVALATVAFLLSAAAVGVALAAVLDLPLAAALLFGALISATDPVAVVAIFQQLGVPQRLLVLVEGESLMNDGVAIVASAVFLEAALGGDVGLLSGVVDFLTVFAGGLAIGVVLGLLAAAVLPWLRRLPAAALTLALAYASFLLAETVLGFSGVMATVAAGLVVNGLAPTRADAEVREVWEQLWPALDYIANAVLFLLLGLAIDPELLVRQIGPVLLAVGTVTLARPLAVVPLVGALERFFGVTRVGRRNEAVLIWGGLRGGVALALALALPEELAQRELIVALTGGVVLATLLLNATTIRALVRRLGLDEPSRADRFLMISASDAALDRAGKRLEELDLDDAATTDRIRRIREHHRAQLRDLDLSDREQRQVIVRRTLVAERDTYQHLSDEHVLPNTVARQLLHEVDDQVEEATLGRPSVDSLRRDVPLTDRVVRAVVRALPTPPTETETHMVWAEAIARQFAARACEEALEQLSDLPGLDPAIVREVSTSLDHWGDEARDRLREEHDVEPEQLLSKQALEVSSLCAGDALHELTTAKVLPHELADRAREALERELRDH